MGERSSWIDLPGGQINDPSLKCITIFFCCSRQLLRLGLGSLKSFLSLQGTLQGPPTLPCALPLELRRYEDIVTLWHAECGGRKPLKQTLIVRLLKTHLLSLVQIFKKWGWGVGGGREFSNPPPTNPVGHRRLVSSLEVVTIPVGSRRRRVGGIRQQGHRCRRLRRPKPRRSGNRL